MQTKNCIDCKDSFENCDVADQGKDVRGSIGCVLYLYNLSGEDGQKTGMCAW